MQSTTSHCPLNCGRLVYNMNHIETKRVKMLPLPKNTGFTLTRFALKFGKVSHTFIESEPSSWKVSQI